jgi:hypothetical protein
MARQNLISFWSLIVAPSIPYLDERLDLHQPPESATLVPLSQFSSHGLKKQKYLKKVEIQA